MNLSSSLLSCAALSTLALATAGCAGAPDGAEAAPIYEGAPAPVAVHLLGSTGPDAQSSVASAAPAGAHLTNYGGPTLTNINVIPVYWTSGVAYQTQLNAFYSAVPSSELYDMLDQYSGIGRGARGAPYVSSQSSTTISDSAIQTALRGMIQAGQIPAPSSANYYPVHFPSGASITASDGTQSCVQWCAYHSTFTYNGVNVNYGVIPDQGGGCAGGCGGNSQRVNNLTSVSSHEMVEATTDPAVGLATSYAPPLAWYDSVNGEIGDICNAQQATIVGSDGLEYVVQREFSNSTGGCDWGVLAEQDKSLNGTCYAPGTIVMQHERMTLIFQSDGNLVLYKTNGSNGNAAWATGTNGKSATSMCLQSDGNMVVYSSSGALWSSKTNNNTSSTLKLQTDCNLVIYNAQGTAKWASGTNNCN